MEETLQPMLEGPQEVLAAVSTVEPAPSKTPASFTFSSVPVVPETSGEESSPSSPLVDPNLLWGASAAAAALAATAYALSRKEEKEAERKQAEEQSLAEANAKVAASEATKTANYIAKRTLEDKLGIPITADIVACSPGLKGLYQNIVNTILGNPTEDIDEDLLLNIENDLASYFNDQQIENGAQTAPASVSWSEFVSTPVGPMLDDAPTAVDYPNLVSLFNQGDTPSNADYVEYSQNQGKQFINGIATFLNGASSVLVVLNQTVGKPIEKILGSVIVQDIYDFNLGVGKEILLGLFYPAFLAAPDANKFVNVSTGESRAQLLGRIIGNILMDIVGIAEITGGAIGGGGGGLVTVLATGGLGTPVAVAEVAGGVALVIHGSGTIVVSSTRLGENIASFSEAGSGESSSSSDIEGNNSAIEQCTLDDLPDNALEMYEKYDQHGWQGNVSGQTPGTAAGRKYDNLNNFLPSVDSAGNRITYQEFDVNNKLPNATRDSERFVRGSDGSVYYTDTHYQSTFLQILGGE